MKHVVFWWVSRKGTKFWLLHIKLLHSLQKSSLFKNYKEPFTYNFKERLHFWSGIELSRRFIFLVALIPFPRNTASFQPTCCWDSMQLCLKFCCLCLFVVATYVEKGFFNIAGICPPGAGGQLVSLYIQLPVQV